MLIGFVPTKRGGMTRALDGAGVGEPAQIEDYAFVMSGREFDLKVRLHARGFRSAFEGLMPEVPYIQRRFLLGWCTTASILLGEHLRESGLGDFHTRSGIRCDLGVNQSHAWLNRDGLIVDITADQFDETKEAVIVSRDSPWHRMWRPAAGSCLASLAFFDGHDHEARIRHLYALLAAAVAAE